MSEFPITVEDLRYAAAQQSEAARRAHELTLSAYRDEHFDSINWEGPWEEAVAKFERDSKQFAALMKVYVMEQ